MCEPRFRAHWVPFVRSLLLLVAAASLLVGVGATDDSAGAQAALRVMQLCCAVLIAGELWSLWALAAPGEAAGPTRGNAGDVATAALAVACSACVLVDGDGLAVAADSALASSLALLLFEVAMLARPAPDAAAVDGKEAGVSASTPLLGQGAAAAAPLLAAAPAAALSAA